MTETSSPGIFGSFRRLAATFVAILQSRLELVAVEWREEMARVAGLLIMGAIAVCGAFLGLITLTALIVIVYWDHAVWVLGGFTLFYAALAVVLSRIFIRGLEKPFLVDTISQLKKDREWLSPPN